MALRIESLLTSDTLIGLIKGEVDAIHQRRFWACAEPERLAQRIDDLCSVSSYALTADFASVGVSVGDASEGSDREELYFSAALDTSDRLREAFFPVGFPGDKMRAVIDELWPAGAMAARSRGRVMLPFNVRRWIPGDSARPHIDQCKSVVMKSLGLKKRLGANLYVEVPPDSGGGELDFWSFPESESRYEAIRTGAYGVDSKELGEPVQTLMPGQGDLILFDAARLHGVRRVEVGRRVTVAGFLGVRNEAEPLVIFC
ncbi:MAG: 2OG-Fe(II) oxygenase [Pseudonocardiaceae bacterium]